MTERLNERIGERRHAGAGATDTRASTASKTIRVELALGGRTYPVTTDAAGADALIAALEQARRGLGA